VTERTIGVAATRTRTAKKNRPKGVNPSLDWRWPDKAPNVPARERSAKCRCSSRARFAIHGPVRARVALLGHDDWTALATSRIVRVGAG
jgi:hypothetical protein